MSTTPNFISLLTQRNVTMKPPVMNRKPLQRYSVEEYNNIIAPLHLPSDYLTFLSEIGPGTLGRCKIFGVTQPMNQFDSRFHSHRLNKLRHECLTEYAETNNQSVAKLDDFVFFAHDIDQEDLWFAYKVDSDASTVNSNEIFVIDVDPEEGILFPCKRICKNGFEQFVHELCLGDRLAKKDVVSAKKSRNEEEDINEEEEERSYSFLPFGSP